VVLVADELWELAGRESELALVGDTELLLLVSRWGVAVVTELALG
jgi:hypothetical protein